jgi:probable HAF family extracellular repeat protein
MKLFEAGARGGSSWGIRLAVLLAGALLASGARAAVPYVIEDLGSLDGTWSYAQAISDTGYVTGGSGAAGGSSVFFWSRELGMVEVGGLGGTGADPVDVSNSGQVVGVGYTPGNAEIHAFSWTLAGGLVDLGTLGGNESRATGVDDHGMVVGYSYLPGNTDIHAFAWTAETGMIDLGTFGGQHSSATAVSASGLVVGGAAIAPQWGAHPFTWTRGGPLVDLGTLGYESASAQAVSDTGYVAIQAAAANYEYHAALWAPGVGLRDLGTLGGGFALPVEVNALGHVVGGSYPARPAGATQDTAHGFFWSEQTGMVDVGTLGGPYDYSSIWALNDADEAAGFSFAAGDVQHAFVWTPANGMTDLGTLAGSYSDARDLNDAGLVVGYSPDSRGYQRAVLWQRLDLPYVVRQIDGWLAAGKVTEGLANALTQKLLSAQAALAAGDLAAARLLLDQVISQATAQSGRHLDADVAARLVSELLQLEASF